MSGLTALVTNALEFAGPPAVLALCNAGFQVIAHDTAFVDTTTKDRYQKSNPGVMALTAQIPADIVDARAGQPSALPAVDGPLEPTVR